MPSAIVPVEFVPLAEAFELSLSAIHLVSVRVLIIVAEQSKKRATETVCEINWRDRALGVEQILIVHNDIAAPAIDDSIYRIQAASTQVGVPASRAKPDKTNLSRAVRLST